VISCLDTLQKLFFKNVVNILGAKEELTKKRSIAISILAIYINALSSLILILYTIKSLQIIVNLGSKVLVQALLDTRTKINIIILDIT
jgi:hypothetical protein